MKDDQAQSQSHSQQTDISEFQHNDFTQFTNNSQQAVTTSTGIQHVQQEDSKHEEFSDTEVDTMVLNQAMHRLYGATEDRADDNRSLPAVG